MSSIYGLREADIGRPLAELTSKTVSMPDLPTIEQLTQVIDESRVTRPLKRPMGDGSFAACFHTKPQAVMPTG